MILIVQEKDKLAEQSLSDLGVRQGDVIRPIHFNSYINEMTAFIGGRRF